MKGGTPAHPAARARNPGSISAPCAHLIGPQFWLVALSFKLPLSPRALHRFRPPPSLVLQTLRSTECWLHPGGKAVLKTAANAQTALCAHGRLWAQLSALPAPWSPFSVRPVDLSPPCVWHQWGPGAWPSARHVVGVHGHLLRGESIHSASRSCSFTLPNAGRSCRILPQPLEEVLTDGRLLTQKMGA